MDLAQSTINNNRHGSDCAARNYRIPVIKMNRYVSVTQRSKRMNELPKACVEPHDGKKKARVVADEEDRWAGAGKAGGMGGASGQGGFQLLEKKGDLFGCPKEECLAHCISEDVRMGKGIAKIFKEKYGGVNELLNQGVKSGGVAVLRRGSRFIYYLVTKQKYWNKPTYDSLARSLRAMADHCSRNNVRSMSMPRIGCGLDGLRWDKVEGVIRDAMGKTDITVTVYTL